MSEALWMTCHRDPKWAAQEIERLRSECKRLDEGLNRAEREQNAAELMAMRDELAAVYKSERKLINTLRDLLIAAETRPVLSGDGVKAVREAGKFMKAVEAARALLAALGG